MGIAVADFGFVEATLVFALVGGVSLFIWYELRILRSRRKQSLERGDLPETAHNALVTTRAIRDALGAGGVATVDADVLILRAEGLYEQGAYRDVAELCGQARDLLVRQKAQKQQQGDLARLEQMGGSAEKTTKERLAEESPPHFMQSRFTINLARDSVETGRRKGYDVAAAESALASATAAFDAKDYASALRHALQAKRSAEEALPPGVRVEVEGERPPSPPPSPVPAPVPAAPPSTAPAKGCPQCGSGVGPEDDFCRKCGMKLARTRACAACATPLKGDDPFCRKCGARA